MPIVSPWVPRDFPRLRGPLPVLPATTLASPDGRENARPAGSFALVGGDARDFKNIRITLLPLDRLALASGARRAAGNGARPVVGVLSTTVSLEG